VYRYYIEQSFSNEDEDKEERFLIEVMNNKWINNTPLLVEAITILQLIKAIFKNTKYLR